MERSVEGTIGPGNERGGGGTIGIGVEACTKDGSKEVVRSKGVGEGVESELERKLEGMGLTESEGRLSKRK